MAPCLAMCTMFHLKTVVLTKKNGRWLSHKHLTDMELDKDTHFSLLNISIKNICKNQELIGEGQVTNKYMLTKEIPIKIIIFFKLRHPNREVVVKLTYSYTPGILIDHGNDFEERCLLWVQTERKEIERKKKKKGRKKEKLCLSLLSGKNKCYGLII